MQSKKQGLVAILLVGAVGAAFYWLWARQHRSPPPLVLSGTLEARTVDAGSLVGGRVAAVEVDEGSEVVAGQLLVRLETPLLPPQLDRQRSVVAEAAARLALVEAGPRSEARERARVEWEAAKTDLGRSEALHRDGVAGRAEYDRAIVREAVARKSWEEADRGSRRPEIAAARAAVERERSQLVYLERQVGELEIRSPVAGRIEAFDLRPGDLVAANQPVATILEPGELWVRVYVPEPELARVAVGAPARVRIDGLAGRTLAARVVEIRHQAEYLPRNVQTLDQRSDQVFAVKVALERPAPGASPWPRPWPRPGMAAFVELEPVAATAR